MSLLENMNSLDLGEPNRPFDKVAIPIGSIEHHGPVLPYNSDAVMSLEIAARVAERVEGLLVLPLMPYGVTLHHVDLYGSVSLRPDTLVDVLLDVMRSFSRHGVRHFWFVSNHDGNVAPLEVAARLMREEDPNVIVACQVHWWVPAAGVIPPDLFETRGKTGMGHGGEMETSVVYHLRPELVHMEHAKDFGWPLDAIPAGGLVYWNMKELTDEGVAGDPRPASVEKGAVFLDAIVDHSVRFLTELDRLGWQYGVGAAERAS